MLSSWVTQNVKSSMTHKYLKSVLVCTSGEGTAAYPAKGVVCTGAVSVMAASSGCEETFGNPPLTRPSSSAG